MDESKKIGETYQAFVRKMKRLRIERGFSQGQLAAMLDLPQSTYAGYESGSRRVPLSLIKTISQVLNVSMDYLTDEEDIAYEAFLQNHLTEAGMTVAAHHDTEDWTEEELQYIDLMKKVLKEKRRSSDQSYGI